jgi:hypothetical protein
VEPDVAEDEEVKEGVRLCEGADEDEGDDADGRQDARVEAGEKRGGSNERWKRKHGLSSFGVYCGRGVEDEDEEESEAIERS